VLYAPAFKTLNDVRVVAGALSKPVNVLAPPLRGVTIAELAEAGARRISLGGALARAAITALLRAGTEMRERGAFTRAADLTSTAEVSRLLGC
jgi:2-methylisocitrate lyase-like PEP mutase family enzyme